MKKRFKLAILLAMAITLAVGMYADDGMWLPHQIKDLNLKEIGLRIDPAALYNQDGTGLVSAVVNLGGGTGEFVSAEGLILTNHHVAYGGLQRASSKDNDYIQNGFLAMTREQEIPAQGYTAGVLLKYEDVTAKVMAYIKPKMSNMAKYEAYDRAEKELTAQSEKAGRDLRCYLVPMYSGNAYYLFTFKQIRDVRLVYSPPLDLGNFGGETDNWMWPRHTCDFSFLRAYVAPDGTSADYSTANVPYKPKVWLKPASEPLRDGDLTFIVGYPGRTYRNYALAEFKSDAESLAKRVENFKELIAFYEAAGAKDKEVEIRYASNVKGLYNGLKNYQGKLDGFKNYGIEAKKVAQEKELLAWIAADTVRAGKYGSVVTDMTAAMEKQNAVGAGSGMLSGVLSGSTIMSQAYTILRAVDELQKPEKKREAAFQDKNIAQIKQRIPIIERSYVFPVDRELFKFSLKRMKKANPEEGKWPAAVKALLAGDDAAINARVDDMYARTTLGDPRKRVEMLSMKPAELAALNDPFINLAAALESGLKGLREEGKGLSIERNEAKKAYEAAILEMKKGVYAPDANGTIRFTYGPLMGYKPRDAVYYFPQTTLSGVIQKDTGEYPFNVPDKLKKLWAAKDFGRYFDKDLNDVPACFLNTTNVTGGNSGSPTLNAKGEQVGIIFDMTYESVVGDYYIIPELQRSVSVDLRYVLFITEKFSGATHLIKEMGL